MSHLTLIVVVDRLGNRSWREAHLREWGVFNCTSIRIGDYECTNTWPASGGTSFQVFFSDLGIYFQLPHIADQSN